MHRGAITAIIPHRQRDGVDTRGPCPQVSAATGDQGELLLGFWPNVTEVFFEFTPLFIHPRHLFNFLHDVLVFTAVLCVYRDAITGLESFQVVKDEPSNCIQNCYSCGQPARYCYHPLG